MTLQNFTSLDFDQIKALLIEYIRSDPNFTDYDFEGSNLSSIINLMAYNTYVSSYNANMLANEVFLESATLRENVVALARSIGYTPRSRRAARATVSFFVNCDGITPKPTSLTLQKGIVAASTGNFAGQSFVFSLPEDTTVSVVNGVASFDELEIYEGNRIRQEYTFDTTDPNQRFIIDNVGVDTDTLVIRVKDSAASNTWVYYHRKEDLFGLNSESKIFFLQEIEDERYEITFGDGVFGKQLQEGNIIEAVYITSSGDSANGVNGFAFSGRLVYVRNGIEYVVSSGISVVNTDLSAAGGDSIESIESIRQFAPKIYASQNRALTATDYEVLIPTKIYPETESISVFGGEDLVPPQYGKVFISIKPKFGDFLPNLIKQNITRELKRYSVAGIVPEILDLKYLYLETESQVYYNTNQAANAAELSSIVRGNIEKYADSTELNRYGARFKYSKFQKIIDDSNQAITSNITKVRMRRDLRVLLNTFAEYQIGFGNEFHIGNLTGYNIKSTAFRVRGITGDVYLSDIPDSDRLNGSIFLFSVPSPNSNSVTIRRRNVGRIDYKSGIITLSAINIQSGKEKDGQQMIEISAVPQSNDVVGFQDLYLQLDVSNSTVEMVSDNIASGLDVSGSSYIVSSSYTNGNLVRV